VVFVSVASKGVSAFISRLKSTLAKFLVSVASKGLSGRHNILEPPFEIARARGAQPPNGSWKIRPEMKKRPERPRIIAQFFTVLILSEGLTKVKEKVGCRSVFGCAIYRDLTSAFHAFQSL